MNLSCLITDCQGMRTTALSYTREVILCHTFRSSTKCKVLRIPDAYDAKIAKTQVQQCKIGEDMTDKTPHNVSLIVIPENLFIHFFITKKRDITCTTDQEHSYGFWTNIMYYISMAWQLLDVLACN